jgi:hypothetical protein
MRVSDPHQLRRLWEKSCAGDGCAWDTLNGKLRPHVLDLVRSWPAPRIHSSHLTATEMSRVEVGSRSQHEYETVSGADGLPQ